MLNTKPMLQGALLLFVCGSQTRILHIYFFFPFHRRCGGGAPTEAWKFWKTHGLVTGGLYHSKSGCQPYTIPGCDHHEPGHLKPCGHVVPTPPCHHTCRAGYNVTFDKDRHFGNYCTCQRKFMTRLYLDTS